MSKTNSSVFDESSKSPPQSLDNCNNEVQKTIDLDVQVKEKYKDIQKRYNSFNIFIYKLCLFWFKLLIKSTLIFNQFYLLLNQVLLLFKLALFFKRGTRLHNALQTFSWKRQEISRKGLSRTQLQFDGLN